MADLEALRKRVREEKARRIARGKADPSLVPHGTPGGRTNWGCDCTRCVEAERQRLRQVSERRKADRQARRRQGGAG